MVDLVEAVKAEPDDEGENARREPRVPPARRRRSEKEDEREKISPREAPDGRVQIVEKPREVRREEPRRREAVREGEVRVPDEVRHPEGMTRKGEVVGEQERERRRAAEHEESGRPQELLPAGDQHSEERGQQEEHGRLRADDDPEGSEKTREKERQRARPLAAL